MFKLMNNEIPLNQLNRTIADIEEYVLLNSLASTTDGTTMKITLKRKGLLKLFNVNDTVTSEVRIISPTIKEEHSYYQNMCQAIRNSKPY